MAIAKRIFLFIVVNFLVMAVISFFLYIFNVQPYLRAYGLNYQSLAVFCLIWGMGGAFISLALSRIMAKWMMGVQIIDPHTQNPQAKQLLDTVYTLARKAGLSTMPEVGVFQSPEANAFATGPTKARSLVAVSSGLLQRMNSDEVEAVLGHEITHITNGDMVTMTLLQGVVNAFVMFLARILAYGVSTLTSRRDSESSPSPFMYQILVFIFEMVFMVLGSIVVATFSRWREFRADAGGARLAGRDKMINALEALKRVTQIKDVRVDQPAYQALKISNPTGMMRLFASHPPLDERIARLRQGA